MGKMLLYIVLGLGALFSIASINISRSKMGVINNSLEQFEKSQANLVAVSGIDYAIMQLNQDTSWSGIVDLIIANGSGTLNVDIHNTQLSYPSKYPGGTGNKQITSIGYVNEQTDTVWAVVTFPPGGYTGGPFAFALASQNNMTLNGNTNIYSTDPAKNANVHTNQTLIINGNNSVEGFGSYSTSYSSNPAKRINTTFQPNSNPDNEPVHQLNDTISIPYFDPDDYLPVATEITSGNLTKSGNIQLGTKDNPKIWYVSGNLTLNGNLSGYGCFLVKGSITINGNVTVTSEDPSGNNLGLYTKGSITLNGNVTVKAQMLARNQIIMNGNVNLYGSAVTRSQFIMNGNIKVHYKAPLKEITSTFVKSEKPARPKIISYYY